MNSMMGNLSSCACIVGGTAAYQLVMTVKVSRTRRGLPPVLARRYLRAMSGLAFPPWRSPLR